MHTLSDVHKQFAECFQDSKLKPFAYMLSKRLQEGHICIPIEEVLEAAQEHPYLIERLPDFEKLQPFVSSDPEHPAPFMLHGQKLYFHRYFNYETQIIEKLQSLIEKSHIHRNERMALLEQQRGLIESLKATYLLDGVKDNEKPDWQLSAALLALLGDFTIITGGPGTGKTTTLAKILQLLYAMYPHASVALAAPTGKASMRMYESLQGSAKDYPDDIKQKFQMLQPRTIHGLLGYRKNSIYFKYNEQNPLPFDWVIVDEASMIDVPMFSKLLQALGKEGRVIFLGDKDQLASVEAGSLLGDLCKGTDELNQMTPRTIAWLNSFIAEPNRQIPALYETLTPNPLAGHMLELKLSHRFKNQGKIGKLSEAIIESDLSTIESMMQEEPDEQLHIDFNHSDAVLEDFVNAYSGYIQEQDIAIALKRFNSHRVLVTFREGEQGLFALNRKIENILQRKNLLRPSADYYENRPLMVTRNNFELGLFNGDIGLVRSDENGQLRVWFEDAEKGLKSFLPAYLSDTETVFATTIHKSQGSEFDRVLVVLPNEADNALLTRELVYTAVTRARKQVIIQGSAQALLLAASRAVKRISGLNERFIHTSSKPV